jgi:hypothetical protein
MWILLLGGTPINSFEELVKTAKDEELWSKEEESAVLKTIWDARMSVDPELKIQSLIDSEPFLLYAIDYKRNEKEDGVNPLVFANSGKSISEIIVKATAGILLNGELSSHFTYLENGEIIINPDNPPTMDHGHELIRRILTIKDTGKKIENYSSWTLGMVSDMLETYFGNQYDPTIVMDATGVAYNTYSTSLNVFRNCWHTRRPNLTFTHHKEVFYANIEDEQKELALDVAEKLQLNVANLRKLLSYIRHYGQESIKIEELNDEDELLQLISVRSANRNFMFLIPNENKWYKFKGEYEMIPRNASVVINLETKAIIREEGPVPIDDWMGANLSAATPGTQPRRRARRRTRREILRDAQLQQDVVEAEIDSTAEEAPFSVHVSESGEYSTEPATIDSTATSVVIDDRIARDQIMIDRNMALARLELIEAMNEVQIQTLPHAMIEGYQEAVGGLNTPITPAYDGPVVGIGYTAISSGELPQDDNSEPAF